MVKSSCISKRCILSNRRIIALRFPIRFKSRCIKRNKSRTTGLCSLHSFYRCMNAGNFCLFTCNQTYRLGIIRLCFLYLIPSSPYLIVILNISHHKHKDQISTRCYFIPYLINLLAFSRFIRLPFLKKIFYCSSCFIVNILQIFYMQFSRSFKTLSDSSTASFFINP